MSWIHFLEFFFAVLLGLSLHNHRAHFFWRCVRSLKKSDLYDCISCESEFCVTTGRNVPTTQFNLAKKWLAKKWEPLLDWVHDALFLTTDLDLTNALLLLILSDPCVYLSANHLFAKNKFG